MKRLTGVVPLGADGAIVGKAVLQRALYAGKFTLEQALAAVTP